MKEEDVLKITFKLIFALNFILTLRKKFSGAKGKLLQDSLVLLQFLAWWLKIRSKKLLKEIDLFPPPSLSLNASSKLILTWSSSNKETWEFSENEGL